MNKKDLKNSKVKKKIEEKNVQPIRVYKGNPSTFY